MTTGNLVDISVPSEIPEGTVSLAIVGEAPTEEEALAGRPFVGSSGHELTGWLQSAGIKRSECYLGNVFSHKVPQNNMKNLLWSTAHKKSMGSAGLGSFPEGPSGWLPPALEPEFYRLAAELQRVKPNLILALGPTALWATTGLNGIGKFRGSLVPAAEWVGDTKVLASYAPSQVLRNYSMRAAAIMDVQKAALQMGFPEIKHVQREVYIEPSIPDLYMFEQKNMAALKETGETLAVDIETANDTITCIGFAPTSEISLVVPFYDKTCANYWGTPEKELTAWNWVRRVLENPKYVKLFHNGSYDIAWLSHKMGFQVNGVFHDTMLMSHSLEPELPKSLGHLSSIYCDIGEWKTMIKHDTNKDDE